MRKINVRWPAAVLLLLAAGCKDITGDANDGPNNPPISGGAADTVTISIENFRFVTPNGTDTITVALGQTIRFVNQDAAPHTATSTDAPTAGEFDSGMMSQGDVFYWKPGQTGSWTYRCDFHPSNMSGAVVRVGTSAPPNDGGGGGGSGDVAADTVLVDVLDFAFRAPNGSTRLQIVLGQTVQFINRGRADHTATSTGAPAGGAFNSGNLAPGQSYFWTPTLTGDRSYICDYHDEMTGTIQVASDTTSDGFDPPGGATISIDMTDGGFVGPNGNGDVTLSLGESVEWVNKGALIHTASARDAPAGGVLFDSGDLAPGASFLFTPDRVGVWEYRCDEHSDEPEGRITVQ